MVAIVVRMASSSASGSKLAELEEELNGLKAQKGAELKTKKHETKNCCAS